jgi:hypothetical protein
VISKRFLLVKEVGSAAAQVYDLRASIPILFQSGTLEAVEGIRYSLGGHLEPCMAITEIVTYLATANNALVLIVSK